MLLIATLAPVAILASAQSNQQPQPQQFDVQESFATPCQLLASTFRGQVSFPAHELYTESQSQYWSAQQSNLKPFCRFFPKGARDIQKALADILIPCNVSIAIASGGQSSIIGASNIDDGITVDLSKLSGVHLGDNNKTVSVGAGARWGEVYAKLEPLDLTVAGSRTATDGVGVFVLGGGLSWYSNQHGWACDSVLEFEVVTPRGEILWVNNETHEGLFWGLKGSSGALGIVTKIKMPTITSESIYGGRLTFDEQQLPGIIEALKNLAVSAPDDPDSQGYLSITWRSSREVFYSAYLVDTANRPASPGLNAFYTIPRKTSSLRFMTIGESAEEVGDSNTHGLRRSQFTLTARLRPEVMQAVHDLVRTVAEEITFGRNDSLDMTFQPITISHLLRSYRSNVFNLDPSRGPLLLISFELSWSAPADDEYFADIARALRGTLERRLRSRKVLEDWIHPNYAAKEQSPFEGEGWKQSPNGKMLRAVARKYDPDGLWRKMVPGIWHV